jgi:2-phosphosulfolactate phosphatase
MMPTLEICLTPDLLRLYNLKEKTVVVTDIFRATSCMVAGLANGVEEVVPVATVAEALKWREQGYVAAGERNGIQVEGFDIGNSPFEHMTQQGRKIVMTTTNGTQAIHYSRHHAKEVIIGAFLNLNAVLSYLRQKQRSVIVLCAGWKGRFNMEDTLFAGAVVEALQGEFVLDGDDALAALSLYQTAQSNLLEALKPASHYQRLIRTNANAEEDMRFCLEMNRFDVLPILKGETLIRN